MFGILSSGGGIEGGGTLNFLPKFSPDGTHLTNSGLFDDGTTVTAPQNFIVTNRIDANTGQLKIGPLILVEWANTTLSDTSVGNIISLHWSNRTLHDGTGAVAINYTSSFVQIKGSNADLDLSGFTGGNNLRIAGDPDGTVGNGLYLKAYNGGLWVTGLQYLNSATNPNLVLVPSVGNVGIGTSNFGASSVGILVMVNSTPPTTDIANQFAMYANDIVAGNAAPHFRTELGDIIKLFKGAALTGTLTSITHTAPGAPDYAIQDLVQGVDATAGFGFATKDEGNTVLSVILNLQTRVNELEARSQAAGQLA